MKDTPLLLVKPPSPHLFIGYSFLAAALRQAQIPFEYIDLHFASQDDFAKLLKKDFSAVAMGGLIPLYSYFAKTFAQIKQSAPSLPCILGGNIIRNSTDSMLHNIPADFFVNGEGEITLVELMQALHAGDAADTAFSHIDGLIYRPPHEPAALRKNRPRARLTSLELPMPTWDFMPDAQFAALTGGIYPVTTGRGCVGQCAFCSPTVGGHVDRPVAQVLEELSHALTRYDVKKFGFLTEIFFTNPADIELFCHEYRKLCPSVPWTCNMRIDGPLDMLPLMKECGCEMCSMGVESGSDNILAEMKKQTTSAMAARACAQARAANMTLSATWMVGNYKETPQDLAASFDFMIDHQLARMPSPSTIYPGTLNYIRAQKQGRLVDEEAYLHALDDIFERGLHSIINLLDADNPYVNISAMDDRTFVTELATNFRRFFPNMRVKNATHTRQGLFHRVQGACPTCGTLLRFTGDAQSEPCDMVNTGCPTCQNYYTFFDPWEIPAYAEHFQNHVLPRIQAAKGIAVLATRYQVGFRFLVLDHLHVPFHKFAGFIANEHISYKHILQYDVMDIENAVAQGVDTVIVPAASPQAVAAVRLCQQRLAEAQSGGKTPEFIFLRPWAEELAELSTDRA